MLFALIFRKMKWPVLVWFGVSFTAYAQEIKTLRFEDTEYEPQIKSVRLYAATPTADQPTLYPAVTRLGQHNLVLEFDDLVSDYSAYHLRLVHCHKNWEKSNLADLDFIAQFNEVPITQYEFSLDTRKPYVHYWVELPTVKLPGNYLAVVYRDGEPGQIVLSRRFMVYEPQVTFSREGSLIGPGTRAGYNQQINFTVNYRNVDLTNPLETVHVTVRQNQRWDNLMEDVKPSFIRESEYELDYRFFADERLFSGGNEFRYFDLRSLNYPGRNVLNVNRAAQPPEAFIQPDKSRAGEAYAVYRDYNGNFLIDNLDYRDINAAEYIQVNFSLLSAQPVPGDVYLASAFNNWHLGPSTRMTYNSAQKRYEGKFLLKQGWYDYQYVVKSNTLPIYHFEGSHYETENLYEVFVYYRAFHLQADLLIGYFSAGDFLRN
jgi:hypothetical protein